jgi:hypothetical protein
MMTLRSLVSLLLPLLAMACLAILYLTGHPLRGGLLTADAMYLPTLADDVLRQHGHLSDWFLTPAPYFFPDFPMYLVAYWLGSDAYAQIIIFSVIQYALLFQALHGLAQRLEVDAPLPWAAFGVSLLGWLTLSAQEPFVLSLANAYHFGSFLSAIWCVTAWLRFEQTGARSALWIACALACLTSLSDSLFILHAMLPLALAGSARVLLESGYLASYRRRLALPWAPMAAAMLGYASYKRIVTHPTRYQAAMDFKHIGANLHDLGIIAASLWAALPPVVLGLLVFLAFSLACVWRLATQRDPFGLPRALAWLLVFWVLSLCGEVAVSLLVHNMAVTARYFIAALCWPVLLAPLVLAHLLRNHALRANLAVAGTLACTAAIAVATVQHWHAHPLQTAYYTDDMACLDRAIAAHGLHHGIAQYWDAKPLQGLSRQHIQLAQHDFEMNEFQWITSTRYFRPAYDFAIVGPVGPPPHYIAADKVEAINGKPQAQVGCGPYTVLIYGRDSLKVR